jgi:hypothetical protein
MSRWLGTNIRKQILSDLPTKITKAVSSNVFNPSIRTPKIYSSVAKEFLRLETKDIVLYFDYLRRDTLLNPEAIKQLEAKDKVFVGYEKSTKFPIFVNFQDEFVIYDGKAFKNVGSFYSLVGINEIKVPLEYTTLTIFSQDIHVAIILGYLMGLNNLIKFLNAKHRLIPSNKQSKLESFEYEIKFKDYKLILDRREIKNTLILGGLTKFDDLTREVFIKEMDTKEVYFDFYKYLGLNSIYLKETDLYNEMFIDPITKEILIDMKEPETFIGLLIKANEMLVLDDHPSSVDMDYMRIRGYERIPGIVYKELVSSVREQRNKSVIGKSQFSMNPFAVWKAINLDPGVSLLSDINPIQNLKQQEAVTFAGTGGRSKDTIVARDRVFNKSDIGVISESTSDSSDVGVNTYLTANPSIKNVRGMKDQWDYSQSGSAGVLSTSSTLAPGATNDDPKRVNFISIQNSHTVGCDNYRQAQVRTGYEAIVGQRTKALFCLTAKKPGKVISITDKGIIVEYNDGEKVGARLGRQFGNHEGSTYPQDVTTNLKEGMKVNPGEAICYNPSFFEPDFFDPKFVVFKTSMTAKTVLLESSQTLEDSSSLSKEFADKMEVRTTKVKSIIVNFGQNLGKIHKLGPIDYNDVYFYIEDEITSGTDIFNEENIETLKSLAINSPKCKYNGVLDKIEVYYHGEKEDMSESLRKLADMSDRNFKQEGQSSNSPVISGSVSSDYRVEGNPLMLDTAEIKLFVTVTNGTGVGDKGVFSNQLKSVIGSVMDNSIVTEDGEVVDAVFGSRSIANRIVLSSDIIGTTTTLLKTIASRAVEMFGM